MQEQEDDGVGPIEVKGKGSADGMADLHGAITMYLTLRISTGNPPDALVNSAITFLKNNAITSDPATNAKLADLSQSLQERRNKKGGLSRSDRADLDGQFSSIMGGLDVMQ